MRIALIGYGKMGKAIEEIALQRKHEIAFRVTHDTGLNFEELKKADVAIEFTNPHSAYENVTRCFEAGVPVVCGTTGWNEKLDEAKKICREKSGAFFYASNFSVGVNIFFELNKKLAQLMSRQLQYQVWLEEVHHAQKKDSPSGTAITLANDIINTSDGLHDWRSFRPDEGEEYDDSDKSVLNIISSRKGDVPGTHEVHYYSEEDDIKMVHTAHGRKGFASGAILAAEFLAGRKGVFSMKDLLSL
jgi:4-hydroxy-tetrahydrodipicolinate reductase